MSSYTIEILARKDILTVYPLIRLAMPQIDLRCWRRFALAATGRGHHASAGILVARSHSQQYICGMLTYRALPNLFLGRTLEVGNMIAMDILYPRRVLSELLRALGPLARAQNCNKVRIIATDSTVDPDELCLALRDSETTPIFEQAANINFPARECAI